MAKRKTAEEAQDNSPALEETAPLTAQPPAAGPAEEDALATERQPGDAPQKSWVKKANVIVDPEAAVKFAFDYDKHKAIISFDEKPAPELLAVARPILNEGGFRWDREDEGWTKPIRFASREDDRREAKKTFYAVANAIREQKGLPARNFGEAMAF